MLLFAKSWQTSKSRISLSTISHQLRPCPRLFWNIHFVHSTWRTVIYFLNKERIFWRKRKKFHVFCYNPFQKQMVVPAPGLLSVKTISILLVVLLTWNNFAYFDRAANENNTWLCRVSCVRLCIFFCICSAFVFVFTFEDFPVDCKELVEPGGSSVYQFGLCTSELGRHERSFLSIYTITSAACPNLVLEIAKPTNKKIDSAP